MDGTKIYRFTLRFGEARDTDDADCRVTAATDARPTDAAIAAALEKFRGDIMQVPPAYSAVKVAGERAYDLARAGAPPTLEARPARVDRFELIERPDADTAIFEVELGKGVYTRSLARDLAQACGSLGHVAALRRKRVGPFTEEARFAGQTGARRGYPADFPGLPAPRRDRAGRHPGAGLDGSGSLRPRARPGDQPGGAHGPDSTGGQPRWGAGARDGGGARDRAVPAARRLAQARAAALAARSSRARRAT